MEMHELLKKGDENRSKEKVEPLRRQELPRPLEEKRVLLDYSKKEEVPARRQELRQRLEVQRALLDYTAADRTNHTYTIFAQVRRNIPVEVTT